MAGNNNPANNLSDEDRRRGGEASSSKQDMSELGRKGAEAQSKEAKAEGGRHSGGNNQNTD